GGLRIDLCLLAMVALIPATLSPWLSSSPRASAVCAWWFRVWWLLLVLMEVATPQFILEYDIRPNRLFFEYLVYPREVVSMLWEAYKGVLAAAAVAMSLAVWLSRRLFPLRALERPWPFWRAAAASVAIFLA